MKKPNVLMSAAFAAVGLSCLGAESAVMPGVTYHWNGTSTSTSLETSANWQGSPDLDLTSGTSVLDLSTGYWDGTVSASSTLNIYGVDFAARADGFWLRGGGTVRLGQGGFKASGGAAHACSVQIETTSLPQTWEVTSGSLKFNSPLISPMGSDVLTLSGGGMFWFNCSGENFAAPVTVTDGSPVRALRGVSLGVSDAPFRLQDCDSANDASSVQYLKFDDSSECNRPIEICGATKNLPDSGLTVTFKKPVTFCSSSGEYSSGFKTGFSMGGNGSRTVFEGGLLCTNIYQIYITDNAANARTVVNNKPLICDKRTAIRLAAGTTGSGLELNASSNVWNNIFQIINGRIFCGAKDALCPTGWLVYGRNSYCGDNLLLDLGGHDQELAGLATDWSTSLLLDPDRKNNYSTTRKVEVTSSSPAVLTVNGSTGDPSWFDKGVIAAKFTGAAGFRFAPAPNAVKTSRTLALFVSDTTGPLEVCAGTLTFSQGAGWGGSTNVTVCQTGILVIEEDSTETAFGANGAKTALHLDGQGKLSIPAGKTVTVDCLYLDGDPVWPDTYGSEGSGAAVVNADHFTAGGGVLKVLRRLPEGMMLILR